MPGDGRLEADGVGRRPCGHCGVARPVKAHSTGCEECLAGGDDLGGAVAVPVVRLGGLLGQLPQQARASPLRGNRPPHRRSVATRATVLVLRPSASSEISARSGAAQEPIARDDESGTTLGQRSSSVVSGHHGTGPSVA